MKGTLLFLSLIVSLPALADSLVWEVSRGENKVYLAGTIHMLKPSDYPLPADYQSVFAKADVVVLETDMDEVQSPVFGMKMAQKMTLPPGESLSSVLKPEVYTQLREFASERGLPMQALANFQPAFVALTLSVLEMQKLGFAEGVEVRFSRLAKEQGKPLKALETPDEQLEFILAMAELEPNDFIRYTLEDMAQLPQLMDEMVAAFKRGDDKAIYTLGAEPMLEYSRSLYDTILTHRNQAWLTQLDQYLNTPETELVMVGALHLVGPEGVPQLLKARGVDIERF
ncbi:TraB/GumN family protein [Gilvimarinus algae]|uniref:TraB/GumN family protein n=1 Tax=Gilvimarinus algae TaxID=3058037 RepID=A0ABT8TBU0_9GAMM|nr:TraB/GumN family protein [Gilvimarinus sp. SDUM040014]MDO3380843.1 TraB/GumN family protein [Gilvimarinus sp. SDUM040014]